MVGFDDDDNDDVNGARLRLWTAATNMPTVYPPGYVWPWRIMVEWYRQGTTPDSSTRTFWQTYLQRHIIASRRIGRRKLWIWPCEVFFPICLQVMFYMPWNLATLGFRLYFVSEGRRAVYLHCPLIFIPSVGFQHANLGSNDNHTNN
jgi:hypothetical protein